MCVCSLCSLLLIYMCPSFHKNTSTCTANCALKGPHICFSRLHLPKIHTLNITFFRHITRLVFFCSITPPANNPLYVMHVSSCWCRVLQEKGKIIVQLLNGVGDLLDLVQAVDPSSFPDFSSMSDNEFRNYVHSSGHCSALVKVWCFFDLFIIY